MCDTSSKKKVKTCRMCKETKDVTKFYVGCIMCKVCKKKYNREYQLINWQHKMVSHSRLSDARYGRRTDEFPYITANRINSMMITQKQKCFYCDTEMQVGVNRCITPEAVTLERVDNDIAHYSDNCILACWSCNRTHGNSYTFEEFMVNCKEIKAGLINKCPDCETIKTRSEFHQNKSKKSGIQHICKPCKKTRNRNNRKRKKML